MPENLELREKLAAQFEMKDLGKLKYFLEVEVSYSNKWIFISRIKYILDRLREIDQIGYKTSGAPIE